MLVDDFFNHEIRKNKLGKDEVWHYKVGERLDSGYYAWENIFRSMGSVSYTHLRAHETVLDLVCRLLLEKKKKNEYNRMSMHRYITQTQHNTTDDDKNR